MLPPTGFNPIAFVVSVAGVLAVAGCKVAVPTKLDAVVVIGGVVVVVTARIVATPVWTPPAGPPTAPTVLAVICGEIALLKVLGCRAVLVMLTLVLMGPAGAAAIPVRGVEVPTRGVGVVIIAWVPFVPLTGV